MTERGWAGLGWAEESVTDAAVHRGLPEVRVVQFSRQHEGRGVGADYLWWWLDQSTDECFGMLVQAKRLRHERRRWTVDIRHRDGKQLSDLARSAARLQVPAMFCIYTGGREFRRELPCFHKKEPDCLGCRRMAISLISAYQLWVGWESPVDTAATVLNDSIPLEDLVDPALPADRVWDVNLAQIRSQPLRDFLTLDQQGPREVAKRIFAVIAAERAMSLSAALADPMTIPGQPLFPTVPLDTGHYPGPYFDHFLRGLRATPPAYVRELREGRGVSAEAAEGLAGIVLVTV